MRLLRVSVPCLLRAALGVCEGVLVHLQVSVVISSHLRGMMFIITLSAPAIPIMPLPASSKKNGRSWGVSLAAAYSSL